MDNEKLLKMLINARDETEQAYEGHFLEMVATNNITEEALDMLTQERNAVIGALDARIIRITELIHK